MTDTPTRALPATDIPVRTTMSGYPEPFRTRVGQRVKRALGDHFGLNTFGVNLTELAPGAMSALMHRHSRQDEFIYILSGHPTLRTDRFEQELQPGDCIGFPAQGLAHHLVNKSDSLVTYLEIGDRTPGDSGDYPEDDLKAEHRDGGYVFMHKDGTSY